MASGATPTYGIPYPISTDPVDVAGDVQDLAVQVDTLLAAKAPLDTPTFTGIPVAPTVSNSDNSTKIATTAFVKNQSYLTTTTASSTYAPIASPTFTGTGGTFTSSSSALPQVAVVNTNTDASAGYFIVRKSPTDNSISSNDLLGTLMSQAPDTGGTLRNSAWISFASSGANTSTYVPSKITFNTTNSAGSTITPLTLSADGSPTATFTGTVVLPAATTSLSSLRIPHGTAPSSPTNGDVWTTTAGMYARINGNTIGPFGTGANWQSAAPSPAITGMLWVDSDNDVLKIYDGTVWYSPMGVEINPQAGSYTLTLTDRSKLIEMGNASAINLLVPTDASVSFPIGTQIQILQTGDGQVTIGAVTPGTTTVNGTPGLKLRSKWSSATLIKRAANTWIAMGDIVA